MTEKRVRGSVARKYPLVARKYLLVARNIGCRTEKHWLQDREICLQDISAHGEPEYNLAADGSVRSIVVHKRSKLIYYTDETTLYIADVWDVRQDPELLNARFEK